MAPEQVETERRARLTPLGPLDENLAKRSETMCDVHVWIESQRRAHEDSLFLRPHFTAQHGWQPTDRAFELASLDAFRNFMAVDDGISWMEFYPYNSGPNGRLLRVGDRPYVGRMQYLSI